MTPTATPTNLALPSGFRPTASGLIVPTEISREREVWTWAEWRDLNRVMGHLDTHQIAMFLRCDDSRCQGATLTRVINPDGGWTLRCPHLDRVVSRAI
jgi:hypothetical protein